MAQIEVARLKLRCGAEQRDRTRFAVEDGLRTSIPDQNRLVLVRKMCVAADLGALQPGARQRAVNESWMSAVARARHGGDDSAGDSNCVWFASREEAERLLLLLLLSGRSVQAWYWALAVPEWGGRSIREWGGECIAQAVSTGEDRRLLAIAQCFVRASAESHFVELLSTVDGSAAAALPPVLYANETRSRTAARRGASGPFERSIGEIHAPQLPPALRRLLTVLAGGGPQARTASVAIARAWTLRQSPALALSPALVPALAEAILVAATRPTANDARPSPAAREARSRSRAPDFRTALTDTPAEDPGERTHPKSAGSAGSAPATARPQQDESVRAHFDDPAIPTWAARPLHSRHAGLWLVLPSLIDLGFREWLAVRPNLLVANPGGHLLHEIARHYRVAPDDPAVHALGSAPEEGARPEWARLWRHGLDRWLRRTVRRRLHDLVNRPGDLDVAELAVTIRYPAEAVDLALRRAALDRDPGWTDWLGLSVRYDFAGTEDWV